MTQDQNNIESSEMKSITDDDIVVKKMPYRRQALQVIGAAALVFGAALVSGAVTTAIAGGEDWGG